MRNLLRAGATFFALMLITTLIWGQVNIQVGETKTENFSIGSSATATLPAGWKADKNSNVRTLGTYSAALTATEQRAGNNMSSSAANGIYNFAAGDATTATDRAIGGISSGSASKSVNLYVQLSNVGSTTIDNLTISYDVEKYRRGSNAAGFSIQMYYSVDGSSWTSAGSDFLTSFTADADNTGYTPAPGETKSVTSKTLSQAIAASGSLYLAWNYSVTSGTTTSNAQALGIDNVSIIANSLCTGNQIPIISNISQTPDEYIQFNYTITVTADVTDADGTVETVELRWGRTQGQLNNIVTMAAGQGASYSGEIPAQPNGITVYYAVFAEDNCGGSTLSEVNSYTVSPVTYLETFEEGIEGLYVYSVTGESTWEYNEEIGAVEILGTDSTEVEQDWLVLPAIVLPEKRMQLSFETWREAGIVDNKNYLYLYYSTNYPGEGDPAEYTWTRVNYSQPITANTWTPSGNVLLPVLPGQTIYVAFRYRYYIGNYVKWRIDNIKFERQTYNLTFSVNDGTTQIADANINIDGIVLATNSQGIVTFNQIESGNSYQYTINKTGFHSLQGQVNMPNNNFTQNVTLSDNRIAIEPSVNSTANSASVSWVGSGAQQYAVFYTNLSNSVQNIAYGQTSPISITVSPSTNYLVRVRTMINGQWVAFSEPTEFETPAGTQVIANNVFVNNITSNSAQVNWSGSGAEEYKILYINTSTSSQFVISSTSSPTTIVVASNSSYDVRVSTKVNGSWLSYTPAVNFTSLVGEQTIASNVTVDNITSSSVRINWNGTGADEYRVMYYDINSPTNLFVSTTASSITIPVKASTNYEVRVRSMVNGTWFAYTAPVSFSTPAGTQIIAETITVGNVTSSSIELSWDGANADLYRVYYRDINTTIQYTASTTSSSITIPVTPSSTFNIRVRTMINGTWVSYSQSVQVLTPAGPQLLATGLNVDDITTNTARVNWVGAGAELYRIYYTDLSTSTQYIVSALASGLDISVLPDRTYRVRIRSFINGVWTDYSESIQFSTPSESKFNPISELTDGKDMLPEGLILYPNPAKEYTNIQLNVNTNTTLTVSIFDLRGSLLRTEKLHNRIGMVESRIDLSSLSSGIYLVRITAPNYSETLRLIVQ